MLPMCARTSHISFQPATTRVHLACMQGVNRGIRSIWLHMPSLHHPAPSHTCQTGLFPHFLALKKNNIFWLKNIDFQWCILAICIPNREVVYLPEQMTRVTLAVCSTPDDCGSIVRMVFIYRVVTLYGH